MAEPHPVFAAAPATGAWIDQALVLVLTDGDAGLRAAEAALQRPGIAPVDRALAHALHALCALRNGDEATAHSRHDEAVRLLDGTAASQRAIDLLSQVRALRHRHKGELAEAEALLRALHARAAQRPLIDAYQSAAGLGIVLSMRGEDMAALDQFYQALSLARQSGIEPLIVNALNNLGSYQADLYNLEDAAPLLEACVAGATRLGSHRQIVFAAGNLVQCLCLMGQAPRALAVAREHLIHRIGPSDPAWLQRDEEIAQALLDNGLLDEAEARLGGDARIDPMSNEVQTARVWLSARLLLARGRPAEALALCLARREAMAAQGESTMAIDRMHLCRVGAQAARETGDHALAYQLLDEAFATHETMLGRAARSRHLSLQISHRLEQAEWERDAARQAAERMELLNRSLQAQIAETQRLQLLLHAQAIEDPLTGLFNRRHLMDAGAALLSLLNRRGESVAVAIVDLDHFKGINDRHGHETGDRVLKGFADLARQQMRAEDIVCRYGGEEFVLVLPGATAAQAVQRLDELLLAFGALRFVDAQGRELHGSFSAGVAEARGPQDALPALLARADAALYAAKRGGRGRVLSAAAGG